LAAGNLLEHNGTVLAESDTKGTSLFFDIKERKGIIHSPWLNDTSKYNAPPIKAAISVLLPKGISEIRVDGATIRVTPNNRFEFEVGHGISSVEW
jgi:hypothetical protein